MRDVVRGAWVRLRGMFRRSVAEKEMEEEFRFHVEMETEKLLSHGVEPEEARRRALAAFGGLDRHRESLREGLQIPLVEPMWRDARFALRSIRRSPGLSSVASLTIALGIGATTTVFTLVDWALFEPLPLPGVERLVSIQEDRSGVVSTGAEGMRIPYRRYEGYRDATTEVFESMAAFRQAEFSLRLPDATIGVPGAITSATYFQTLGIEPLRGRWYDDDFASEIIISHDLWQTAFGGAATAVGRGINVDGRPVTIVGVAPPDFRGTTLVSESLWVPAGIRGEAMHSWNSRIVPIARIREGVSLEQATTVTVAASGVIPAEDNSFVDGLKLQPIRKIPGEERVIAEGFLAMLMGMALVVLLIASANIAGVMLARSTTRRRELAVRLAIGAGRMRIARHVLAESLLLFGLGGVVGIGLAWLGVDWVRRIPLPPQVPISLDLTPDAGVLLFALAITGATGLLFGALPAIQASRPDLVPALKSGGHGASGDQGRLRGLFVGGQVALATILLVTATLFGRSLQKGLNADLGFDPDGVVAAMVNLGPPHDYSAPERMAFFETLVDRMRALPGVESAGLSQYILVSGARSATNVRPATASDESSVHVAYDDADPAFFETMRFRLIEGRVFTSADNASAGRVVVVNRTAAEALFPGESAVGKRINGLSSSGSLEIVGVVEDGRYVSITEPKTAFVFRAYAQSPHAAMAVHARTAPGLEAETIAAMQREVRALDADVAISQAGRIDRLAQAALFPHRFATHLVGLFGLVGLLLAALGIYGTLAFYVARRVREFGIRRALGADLRDVLVTVLRRGVALAAVGGLLGAAVGALVARGVEGFLVGIHPLDPMTFVSVPVLLLVVAVAASALPALKAVAVEPVEALREE